MFSSLKPSSITHTAIRMHIYTLETVTIFPFSKERWPIEIFIQSFTWPGIFVEWSNIEIIISKLYFTISLFLIVLPRPCIFIDIRFPDSKSILAILRKLSFKDFSISFGLHCESFDTPFNEIACQGVSLSFYDSHLINWILFIIRLTNNTVDIMMYSKTFSLCFGFVHLTKVAAFFVFDHGL